MNHEEKQGYSRFDKAFVATKFFVGFYLVYLVLVLRQTLEAKNCLVAIQ